MILLSRLLVSMCLLTAVSAGEPTWIRLTCGTAADYSKDGFRCSSNLCANTTCTLSAAYCDRCLVHYPNAVLDASSGSCCASVSSDGTCVGQESGENPSDDDDAYHGHEPEETKQPIAFREAGGWSSFCFAGTFLVVQVNWMPENRRQMRPRMLLILLGLDAFAGLFFGLGNAPTFELSDKYNNGNASVENSFTFLA